jgi:predicted nucleic acid-binding protein
VDASIAVKWFLDEVHAEAARHALSDEYELLAPDLIWAEVASAFWKRRRRVELSADTVHTLLEYFRRAPVQTARLSALVTPAFELAARYDRTIYDAMYLALAAMEECPLVTGDRKLYDGLKSKEAAITLLWVEDLA